MNRYLDFQIIYSTFTTEIFNLFIRQLLRKMTPYPSPRSVLVIDNAKIYLSEELEIIYREAGVVLEYLPPYSPDFNVIEELFLSLKAQIRRNRALLAEFDLFFEGFIYLAVQMTCNSEKAKGYFKSVRVTVEKDDINIEYHLI